MTKLLLATFGAVSLLSLSSFGAADPRVISNDMNGVVVSTISNGHGQQIPLYRATEAPSVALYAGGASAGASTSTMAMTDRGNYGTEVTLRYDGHGQWIPLTRFSSSTSNQ